ncbi:hypothetical protein BpHYR1_012919 [Brachionus plicatilis]|uniref:Uncharacterized protein n=1 Tax=Brachionus plicatilis TaxID=10195 RepID=A0A3M7P9B4_BRAPC|nr:hypothetical protein BpHYR1_012919 [Brachionus plicatilis]
MFFHLNCLITFEKKFLENFIVYPKLIINNKNIKLNQKKFKKSKKLVRFKLLKVDLERLQTCLNKSKC